MSLDSKERKARLLPSLDRRERPALREVKEALVRKAQLARKDRRALPEMGAAALVLKVHKARRVLKVRKATMAHKERGALKEALDQPDRRGPLERQVHKALREAQERP